MHQSVHQIDIHIKKGICNLGIEDSKINHSQGSLDRCAATIDLVFLQDWLVSEELLKFLKQELTTFDDMFFFHVLIDHCSLKACMILKF